MELKEYMAIFRRHTNLFLGVLLIFLLLGLATKIFQPIRYRAELVLNVTRIGQEETSAYRFDDFYRLQADERFADTIVRWLDSARMQKDIQEAAGAGPFSTSAKRLSSQVVSVELKANNPVMLEEITKAVPQAINRESEKLNQWQKEKNWFAVVADEPVVSQTAWSWDRVIFVSLLLGIFFAFWSVLIAHYLKSE